MDSWIHLLTKKSQHTVFRMCLQIRQRAFISYYQVLEAFRSSPENECRLVFKKNMLRQQQ